MSIIDDGVIKFSFSKYIETGPLSENEYLDLEKQRKKLFSLNLIGVYLPEKIGFGNISIRADYEKIERSNRVQFVISGTQTGGLSELNGLHYTRVVNFDQEAQSVVCYGPIKASSESLTHAAIYEASEKIKAVVHVHHEKLWLKMSAMNYPFTSKTTPYGTAQMADEVYGIVKGQRKGVLVMKGHQDGIIFYAENIEVATTMAKELLAELSS